MTTTITKIVRGKYYDGVTSAKDGYVAKKINDIVDPIIEAEGTVLSVTAFRAGEELVATIVYEEVL